MKDTTKPHLLWWENNLDTLGKDFANWLSSSDLQSRNIIFEHINQSNIKSVLECGPGIFIDYNIFFKNHPDIKYATIDITPKIVAEGKKLDLDISLSSIENIDKPNESYDLVYCRHVLEHQDNFVQSIEEMTRVSKHYVIVAFWLLSPDQTKISFDQQSRLYHNSYSKTDIEQYLKNKQLKYHWIQSDIDHVLIIEK